MQITGSTPNQAGMLGYYINGQRENSFPLFLRGDGEVRLAVLRGLNVETSNNQIRISPTYQPLFIFQKINRGFRFEIRRSRWTVVRAWPPIRFERLEGFPNELRF